VKIFLAWLRRIFTNTPQGEILPQIHISPEAHYVPGRSWLKDDFINAKKTLDFSPPDHVDCKFSSEEIIRLLDQATKATPVDSGEMKEYFFGPMQRIKKPGESKP